MASHLTAGQVADRLDVTASTIRRWVSDGHLPAVVTPGGRIRIDPRAVDGLLKPADSRATFAQRGDAPSTEAHR